MAADFAYNAEFNVSLEKLKRGVVEAQSAIAKLEGELNKGAGIAGRDMFGDIGGEADKAKVKIESLGKSVQKSNVENLKSGETFFSAFKKGWKDSTDVAGGQAVKLGKLVGSVISPMTLAMTAATAVFGLIAKKAKEAFDNWKKHNENVKKAKDLYAALNGDLAGTAKQEKDIKTELDKIRSVREIELRMMVNEKEVGEEAYNLIKKQFDLETERRVAAKEDQLRNKAGTEAAAKAVDAMTAASEQYYHNLKKAEKERDKNLIDYLGFQEKMRDGEAAYIDTLIEEQAKLNIRNEEERKAWVEMEKKINERRNALAEIDKTIAEINEKEKEGTKELTDQQKIDLARGNAEKRYNDTLAKINAEQEEGILTEEAAKDARDGAMAAWKDALQGIVDEYKLTEGITVNLLKEKRAIVGEAEKQKRLEEAAKKLSDDTIAINDQITRQKIDQKKAEAAAAGTKEEGKRLLDEALQMELEILTAQRKREKQEYKLSDAYKLMLAEGGTAAADWEKAFDEATEGMKKSLAGLEKEVKKGFDFKGVASNISQGLGYFQDAAGSVMSITQSMAEDQIAVLENLLEEQKELIEQQYEETMSRLEEERQAALEAAGFVAAITEEGLAAAMEAAIGSGDEAVIYREKRRQEELAINKKYDQLEADAEKKKNDELKAAEEKAAREIAEIQYQQAMADWSMKLAVAPAQIASAILEGFAQAGPFGGPVGAAIMAAVGALQIAAILAAAPKKPAFAGGGVVGLPQTYSGGYANGGIVKANTPRGVDAVDITAANREMLLNDSQQTNLFNAIESGRFGGGGVQTVVVQLVVDGELWADRMVDLINNGVTSPINARMIR